MFKFELGTTDIGILILVGLSLCIISPFILQRLSREISRLSIYHESETMWERIWKLYMTYWHIMSIMWIFIGFSVFSFISLHNILVYTLISSSVFSLTTRIMTTTGMVECSKLEEDMQMDWKVVRERYLSAIYSATVIIVIIAFIGIFILFMLLVSGQGNRYFEQDYLFPGKIIPNILILVFLWLVYPLFLSTAGEILRWGVSKRRKPPEGLIVIDKIVEKL